MPCVHRIILPTVWTNVRTIAFNFTNFQAPQDYGGNLTYYWGLGSEPGVDDVLPLRRFNGTSKVRLWLQHATELSLPLLHPGQLFCYNPAHLHQ